MAEIKFGGAQTYTLPLESLELSYLTKYVQNPREEKQIWPMSRLDGESEYYQIEIVAEEISEDNCYLEPSETYMCHICDIDVPKIFFNKHNESKKHKTFKNICEKVLERVTKQMNLSLINKEKDITDLYYCVPCSKAIKLKNRYRHETSDYHTKSLNNINVLNDFYKICMHNENIDTKDSSENSDAANNNLKCNIAKRKQDSPLDSDDDIFTPESDDESIESDSISKKDNLKGTLKLHNSKELQMSFDTYLKEMIAKYKININIPPTDGDYIYVVTPKGDKCTVSRKNFHSYCYLYKENNKDWLFCQMCMATIPPDTKDHETTETHVRNILNSVNESFARTIHQDWNHCLLCNESYVPSLQHTLSEDHKKALDNAKTPQKKETVMNGKTLCDVCNIYIDTHNFLSHIDSKKHKNKETVMLKQEKICLISSDQYFCVICNVLLIGSNLKSHINSTIHIAKKTESIAAENPEFCDLCNVNVPRGGMQAHNEGNPHTNKLLNKLCIDLKNEMLTLKAYVAKQVDSTATQNKIAPIKNSGITNEIIASASATSINTSNSSNNNSSDVEGKVDEYYKLLIYANAAKTVVKCTVCNVNIVNVKRNVIEHMEGRNHEDKVNNNNNKFKGYFKLMRFTDDTKKEIECTICDVIVPNVEKNIIEHVEGRLHTQDQNDLLSYHKIRKVNIGYFCDCCNCSVSSFFNHINSDEHVIKYQTKYVIDRQLLRKFVYEDDVNNCEAIKYRELYRNLLRINKIIKLNETQFYCETCKSQPGRFNEIDHMLGQRHRSQHPSFS